MKNANKWPHSNYHKVQTSRQSLSGSLVRFYKTLLVTTIVSSFLPQPPAVMQRLMLKARLQMLWHLGNLVQNSANITFCHGVCCYTTNTKCKQQKLLWGEHRACWIHEGYNHLEEETTETSVFHRTIWHPTEPEGQPARWRSSIDTDRHTLGNLKCCDSTRYKSNVTNATT